MTLKKKNVNDDPNETILETKTVDFTDKHYRVYNVRGPIELILLWAENFLQDGVYSILWKNCHNFTNHIWTNFK